MPKCPGIHMRVIPFFWFTTVTNGVARVQKAVWLSVHLLICWYTHPLRRFSCVQSRITKSPDWKTVAKLSSENESSTLIPRTYLELFGNQTNPFGVGNCGYRAHYFFVGMLILNGLLCTLERCNRSLLQGANFFHQKVKILKVSTLMTPY